MELSVGNLLICPSGTPNTPDLKFEMMEIYKLEARQMEIANVNKVTAPELMQAYINGFGATTRILTQLEWQLTQAKKYQDEREAIVKLDVAPEYLAKKGLTKPNNPAGSEDLRNAVLARDDEYKLLSDRVAMLEAATELLKQKAKGFEMSYQAVKKVYDSLSTTNALMMGVHKPAGASPYVSKDEAMAIGSPKY